MVVPQKTGRRVSLPKFTPRKGGLGGRIEAVGPKHFGIVAVDCAKHSSRWRFADFYGRCLFPPTHLAHRGVDFEAASQTIKDVAHEHKIADLIVAIERTGRYHLVVKRAFVKAGWEVRVVDPLATHQFRKPVHAGNKTDDTDLEAIHDAAAHGLGLVPIVLPPEFSQLQDWSRHRRDLVEKVSRLRCQIREHLHALMPGYAELFENIFDVPIGLIVPLRFTAAELRLTGRDQLAEFARDDGVRCHRSTLETILAWARNAPEPDDRPALRQAVLGDLIADLKAKRAQIAKAEIAMAGLLSRTPYLVLLSMPGLNVVTVADLAAEAGPITAYAGASAITGRSGLYPSRYQSGPVDRGDGPLVPRGNRRLRQAILRIADVLLRCNEHFGLLGRSLELRDMPGTKVHIAVGNRFVRVAYRMVASGEAYRHPGSLERDCILRKLINFYNQHNLDIQETLSVLDVAVAHLPAGTRQDEARSLGEDQAGIAGKRGSGARRLEEILTSVLARFEPHELRSAPSGELSPPV